MLDTHSPHRIPYPHWQLWWRSLANRSLLAFKADTSASGSSVDNMASFRETENVRYCWAALSVDSDNDPNGALSDILAVRKRDIMLTARALS